MKSQYFSCPLHLNGDNGHKYDSMIFRAQFPGAKVFLKSVSGNKNSISNKCILLY